MLIRLCGTASIARITEGTWPHAMYKDLGGELHVLPEFNTSAGGAYLLKSLHQMHCIVSSLYRFDATAVSPSW